jgi:cold shock CspA family protein
VIEAFLQHRGYGFIKTANVEKNVFFHKDELMPGVKPSVGRRVRFQLGRNRKGLIAVSIENEDE